jgi:hypothetical protein
VMPELKLGPTYYADGYVGLRGRYVVLRGRYVGLADGTQGSRTVRRAEL